MKKEISNKIQIFNSKTEIMIWQQNNCHQCEKEFQCQLKNDIDNGFASGETSFETSVEIGIHPSYAKSFFEANIVCEQLKKIEL